MFHRWARQAALTHAGRGDPEPDRPSALLVTCLGDCFPPDRLADALEPGAWAVRRTPANIVPPLGAGYRDEDAAVAGAAARGADTVVVCGHWPCDALAAVLDPSRVAADFVARDWLAMASAALAAAGPDPGRALAEQNVLLQLAHLRTHPDVAAGRLRALGWLFDDAPGGGLLSADAGGRFVRRPALDPAQSRWLRRDFVLASRQPAPVPAGRRPYLA